MRSDSLESMADVTSLGFPAASDVADMMASHHTQNLPQQQQQQMLNHQSNNNNFSMDVMHQQQQPSHQQSMNIKQDYGLTAL